MTFWRRRIFGMNKIAFDIPKEEMAQSLIERSLWVSDSIFPKGFTESLYAYSLQIHEEGRTRTASVGRGLQKQRIEEIRGDHISWINNWTETPELQIYGEFLEEMRQTLGQQLLIALKRFEVHFALYPEGAFYKKHIDQHKETRHRQISCVYYLSPWKEGNGGELRIFPKEKAAFEIEPRQGRFVCFLSGELPHEVLKTYAIRSSLTGWFRDDL